MDTDVLIVGAGPTGLMLANQLARRGIKPLIIDRHSGPAQQSRAMAVQARTLEIYSKMGIADQALALGAAARAPTCGRTASGRARIPIGDIGQGPEPVSLRPHAGSGRQRADHGRQNCASSGVEVQWNTELIALEQQPTTST